VASYPVTILNELEDARVGIDSAGNYILAEDNNAQLQLYRITPSGTVTRILLISTIPIRVGGMTFDAAGNYVVTDYLNNGILTITPSGAVRVLMQDPRLNRALGIARDPSSGSFIIVDQFGELLSVSASGNSIITLFEGPPLATPVALVAKAVSPPSVAPLVSGLSPSSAVSGGPAFALRVQGANFSQKMVVRWNGADRPTTFVSSSQLIASIPAADVLKAGTAAITVANPASGQSSNSAVFTILVAAPVVAVSGIVNAASLQAGPVAPEELVVLSGSNLSAQTVTADSLLVAWPTSLGGVTVEVTDTDGISRLAPLQFVSSDHINLLIPADTKTGPGTVRITNAASRSAPFAIQIGAIAPGIFFVSSGDGKAIAAAMVNRVASDGSETTQPVFQCDATGACSPVAIDLGPDSDQLTLILYGTGIRGLSQLSGLTLQIAGQDAAPVSVGPLADVPGVDELTVLIPHSFASLGEADILVTVDGTSANAVVISIL
jgi:uncharacterized protein (TIGR03437 family)